MHKLPKILLTEVQKQLILVNRIEFVVSIDPKLTEQSITSKCICDVCLVRKRVTIAQTVRKPVRRKVVLFRFLANTVNYVEHTHTNRVKM